MLTAPRLLRVRLFLVSLPKVWTSTETPFFLFVVVVFVFFAPPSEPAALL